MKQFDLLEVAGIVSATLLIAFAICGSWFVVEYNKLSDKLNAADAVIETVIEDNPNYYLDVLCETDVWDNYNN